MFFWGLNCPFNGLNPRKILDYERSTTENTELKKVAPGTGAEPNALSQTNNTESKAWRRMTEQKRRGDHERVCLTVPLMNFWTKRVYSTDRSHVCISFSFFVDLSRLHFEKFLFEETSNSYNSKMFFLVFLCTCFRQKDDYYNRASSYSGELSIQ